MRALIACEHSGAVREAFRALGHDAWSADLLPASDGSPFHYVGDVLEMLDGGWDLLIAHPPCTYINSAGLHWIARGRIEADGRPRAEHREEALAFVTQLWNAPVERIVIENPQGCINTALPFMPVPQYVQPYEFGDDASKKTGLWCRNVPWLAIDPLARCPGRWVKDPRNGKMVERWSNQTDSGQNKLPPTADRGHLRAITYPGLAKAMAAQWSNLNARPIFTQPLLLDIMKTQTKKTAGRPRGPKTEPITGLVTPATAREIRRRAQAGRKPIGALLDEAFKPTPK